jgi:hypothetical protein
MPKLQGIFIAVIISLYVESAGAGFQLVEPEPAPANDDAEAYESSKPFVQARRISTRVDRVSEPDYQPHDNQPAELTINGLRHIGHQDIDPPIVRKSGRSVPLPSALKQVLPPGWHAKKTVDIESSMPISWSNGWDWVTTLEDIAKDNHLAFTVDWIRQTVTVEKPAPSDIWDIGQGRIVSYNDKSGLHKPGDIEQPKSLLQPAVFHKDDSKVALTKYAEPEVESRDDEEDESPGSTPKAVPASYKPTTKLSETDMVEPVVPKSPVKPLTETPLSTVVMPIEKEEKPASPPRPLSTYTIASGETLRTVLTRWTEESGWDLVWEPSSDYSLGAGATFHGDMKMAIAGLMESLRDSGAPFGAEMWNGNRVVRVMRVR